MSIDLDLFCFPVPLMILFAAVLSVSTGVYGCGWQNFDRSVLMDVDFWHFLKNTFNSASVADAITVINMLNSTCTVLFHRGIDCISLFGFFARKHYPPTLLHASGYDM